jgi:hypothetical protein
MGIFFHLRLVVVVFALMLTFLPAMAWSQMQDQEPTPSGSPIDGVRNAVKGIFGVVEGTYRKLTNQEDKVSAPASPQANAAKPAEGGPVGDAVTGQPAAVPAPAAEPIAAPAQPPAAEGDFVDNKRTGRGIKVWDNGERYEGDWVNGERHGKGTMVYASGTRYHGDWANDSRYGRGTIEYANGHRYEGDWIYNTRTGKGTYIWPDGARYEGDFSNNQRTGRGTIYLANGNRYEGDFVEGKSHGRGTFVWANGHRYEGDWAEGKRTGNGTYAWPDGDRYVGDFVEGKFNSGTMYRASGAREEYAGGTIVQRHPAPVASAPAPVASPPSASEPRDRSSNNDAAWAIAGALLGATASSQPRQQPRQNVRPPVTQSYTPPATMNYTSPARNNRPGDTQSSVAMRSPSSSASSGSHSEDLTAKLNASHCIQVGNGRNGVRFSNACGYEVKVTFCIDGPKVGSYACSYGFNFGKTLAAGASDEVYGTYGSPQWFACKAGEADGTIYTTLGARPNPPKGRCVVFGKRN